MGTTQGGATPCRFQIGMRTRQGGDVPSLPCTNGNHVTRRGLALPHCVQIGMRTQGGGDVPSLLCRNENAACRRPVDLAVSNTY